jgi:hypothetical protein
MVETTQRINLETFEKLEHCVLRDWEIESIKEEIDHHINTINEGLEEGRSRYDHFVQTYEKQLRGITLTCSMVGLRIRTSFNEVN